MVLSQAADVSSRCFRKLSCPGEAFVFRTLECDAEVEERQLRGAVLQER